VTIYRIRAPRVVGSTRRCGCRRGRRSEEFRRLWTEAPKWIQIRERNARMVYAPSRLDFGERHLLGNARFIWMVLRGA
jgi:hypothetical protein